MMKLSVTLVALAASYFSAHAAASPHARSPGDAVYPHAAGRSVNDTNVLARRGIEEGDADDFKSDWLDEDPDDEYFDDSGDPTEGVFGGQINVPFGKRGHATLDWYKPDGLYHWEGPVVRLQWYLEAPPTCEYKVEGYPCWWVKVKRWGDVEGITYNEGFLKSFTVPIERPCKKPLGPSTWMGPGEVAGGAKSGFEGGRPRIPQIGPREAGGGGWDGYGRKSAESIAEEADDEEIDEDWTCVGECDGRPRIWRREAGGGGFDGFGRKSAESIAEEASDEEIDEDWECVGECAENIMDSALDSTEEAIEKAMEEWVEKKIVDTSEDPNATTILWFRPGGLHFHHGRVDRLEWYPPDQHPFCGKVGGHPCYWAKVVAGGNLPMIHEGILKNYWTPGSGGPRYGKGPIGKKQTRDIMGVSETNTTAPDASSGDVPSGAGQNATTRLWGAGWGDDSDFFKIRGGNGILGGLGATGPYKHMMGEGMIWWWRPGGPWFHQGRIDDLKWHNHPPSCADVDGTKCDYAMVDWVPLFGGGYREQISGFLKDFGMHVNDEE